MKKRTGSVRVLLLLVLLFSGPTTALGTSFSGCGELIHGTGCIVFARAGNPQEAYVLGNYGNFHVGDSVCVAGNLIPSCQSPCSPAIGCIIDNIIDSISRPQQPFQACGILVYQSGCLLFAPDSDPNMRFRLADYGDFVAGDRVCVTGDLIVGCQDSCAGIDHCIHNNTISPAVPSGSYFIQCGVLTIDSGCIMFLPGCNPFVRIVLDSIGDFHSGDIVRVCGTITPGCQSACGGANACVAVDSIANCPAPPTTHILGRAIMRLANADSLGTILSSTGSMLIDSIPSRLTYLVEYPDSVSTEEFMALLRAHRSIIFAEPSYQLSLPEVLQMSMSFPDEAYHPFISDESPTQYYKQPAAYTVGIDSANLRTSGSGALVAVIDNGIDYTQPALAGASFEAGYDFYDEDSDPSEEPGLAFGHGTFVSGLIRLVAPNCRLLPLRAFGSDGVGNSFAIAQSIYYAIDQGATVINMSFGVYECSDALVRACSTAVAAGITLVAASGSDSTFMPIYPAALPGVIAVSALDTIGAIAYLSNYGDYIDVCAPGVSLYSSLAGMYEWGTWSGTSFAAALVTGSCVLVRTFDKSLSTAQVEEYIRSSASKTIQGMTITPPDPYYGYGRIDAAAAVWNMNPPSVNGIGDLDGSGSIDISDAVYLCSYIFIGGPAPGSVTAADLNCDGNVDISDVVSLINYIFGGGEPPGCP